MLGVDPSTGFSSPVGNSNSTKKSTKAKMLCKETNTGALSTTESKFVSYFQSPSTKVSSETKEKKGY